jgi:hypothetical protein
MSIPDATDLFECDCCCQQFKLLDLDIDYQQYGHCTDPNTMLTYCKRCVRTYIENQVTTGQATRPVCLTSRQCQLDDRMVRERLSGTALAIRDRNQVVQAYSSRNDIAVEESM